MDLKTFRNLKIGDVLRNNRTSIYWVVEKIDRDSISITELLDAGRDGSFSNPGDWDLVMKAKNDNN